MVAHPHQVEEEEFAFARMFGQRHWVSHLSQYCCVSNAAGGDCGCHGNPWSPEDEDDDQAVALCPVDGRPVPPVREA